MKKSKMSQKSQVLCFWFLIMCYIYTVSGDEEIFLTNPRKCLYMKKWTDNWNLDEIKYIKNCIKWNKIS